MTCQLTEFERKLISEEVDKIMEDVDHVIGYKAVCERVFANIAPEIRNQALEEAAKACEEISCNMEPGEGYYAARAIRALKGSK